jgi:hypothetical protein
MRRKFQYGGLKPEVMKKAVQNRLLMKLQHFTYHCVAFTYCQCPNWQKGNMNQLQSLVAVTGNCMVARKPEIVVVGVVLVIKASFQLMFRVAQFIGSSRPKFTLK